MVIYSFSLVDNVVVFGWVLMVKDMCNYLVVLCGVNVSWNFIDMDYLDWCEVMMGFVFGLIIDSEYYVFVILVFSLFWGSYFINNGNGEVFWINVYIGQVIDFVFVFVSLIIVGNNMIFNNGVGIGNICYNGDNEVLYFINCVDQIIVVVVGLVNIIYIFGDVIQVFDFIFVGQFGGG